MKIDCTVKCINGQIKCEIKTILLNIITRMEK